MGRVLLAAGCTAWLAVLGACADAAGLGDLRFVGDGGSGAASNQATTTSGTGGSAGAGGAGGAPAQCPNGVLEQGEQCDDDNDIEGDGCHQCSVECDPPALLDTSSLHCYELQEGPQSWIAAQGVCELRNGHLVTITSASELALLSSFSEGDTWIGGHDEDKDGTYEWVTGEPFDFTNWSLGEPNDIDESCIVMYPDLTWNDALCNQSVGFICERPPPVAFP
jgi:cysteine-rich repeat protein